MILKQQLIAFLCVSLFVIVGTTAMRLPQNKPRNLKVLPPDISDQMLDSIMHSYNKALNVNCAFCHAPDKNISNGLNYELDDNPIKEEARKMMRLTLQINKDYFYFDSTKRPEYLDAVSCITCHRGDPMPADLK
jgi:Photosynthetic reaction centre cytochrome C subunit